MGVLKPSSPAWFSRPADHDLSRAITILGPSFGGTGHAFLEQKGQARVEGLAYSMRLLASY
jgi:hypothetical protein